MDILQLAPEAVLKPWGLRHGGVAACSSITVGVGELWLASAQTGPGNRSNTIVAPHLGKTLAEVLREAAAQGDAALEALIGPRPLAALKENPYRGKTEAWYVREVAGRTGVVAGPRTSEQKERIRALLESGEVGADIENWPTEVRELFGTIEPLKGGEAFLVLCGTLHTMFAIGPESRLIIDEIQQGYGDCPLPTLSKILMVQDSLLSVQVHPCDETVAALARGELRIEQDLSANPTVRISDFGRRPGEYPDLGMRLTKVEVGARLVRPVAVTLEGGATLEFMIACRHFAKSRLTLPAGVRTALKPLYGSYRVLHCTRGSVRLEADGAESHLAPGETALVPGTLEGSLAVTAESNSQLFDDAMPDLDAIRAMLLDSGASAADVDGLLDPPRAFPAE